MTKPQETVPPKYAQPILTSISDLAPQKPMCNMHNPILSLKMTLDHGLTLPHVALDNDILVILRISIISGQ